MSLNKQIIALAYESEYKSAYDLSEKKKFSTPKIYTANGNLKKRWYVYFSYRNPETGKLKRITPFYGEANKYKTKEERLEVLTIYRKTLLKLLKEGFNPFGDNKALLEQRESKTRDTSDTGISKSAPISTNETQNEALALEEAFAFALNLKKKLLSKTTLRAYQNRIKTFLNWIKTEQPELKKIDQLNRKTVTAFLNSILDKTSPRNRNNYRVDLSSIIQVLEDNEIIASNFVKKIPVLKSTPKRNKTYTEFQQKDIYNYLEKQDPILLLYIKFISYNFLRPIEVCRLKIGDINLNNKTLQFKAKNSPLKTKIIPDILIQDLPNISQLDKDLHLFTPDKFGNKWDTTDDNKRDYFTKRFKSVVKDHFNLDENYGLYSFRHTFITKLYRSLISESSPFAAKSKLMLITGHTSMTALEKYLRDIDAELPEDYSEMLKPTHG